MNEQFDTLEAELAALRPSTPSAELEKRLAEELSSLRPAAHAGGAAWGPRLSGQAGRRWALVLIGGTLAACIGIVALLPRNNDRLHAPDQPPLSPQPRISAAFDDAQPSVWTYRRALDRSPAELDALLDQHAGAARSAPAQLVQTRGFGRFETSFEKALPGDL
jgi:hypothetical protein